MSICICKDAGREGSWEVPAWGVAARVGAWPGCRSCSRRSGAGWGCVGAWVSSVLTHPRLGLVWVELGAGGGRGLWRSTHVQLGVHHWAPQSQCQRAVCSFRPAHCPLHAWPAWLALYFGSTDFVPSQLATVQLSLYCCATAFVPLQLPTAWLSLNCRSTDFVPLQRRTAWLSLYCRSTAFVPPQLPTAWLSLYRRSTACVPPQLLSEVAVADALQGHLSRMDDHLMKVHSKGGL